ncbi:hypothetical protein Tco_0282347 [Tanacetum coccineum]
MVLQLTDFTSEITDEELREFTSEYYTPFVIDRIDGWFPGTFAFYTQGSLPREGAFQPSGSYSMKDAELINENRIPINAYSEAFLCHMGISHNYFQSPEEVPTFIGDDGQDGEEPLLESIAGRTMELVLEKPEAESTDVLAPTPLRSVPVRLEKLTWVENARRKRATSDDGAGSQEGANVSLGIGRQSLKAYEGMPVESAYGGVDMVTVEAGAGAGAKGELANSADYKASCHWAVKYLEGGKNNHFAGLDEFRQRVEELLEKQEEKLRKLNIEYDEELYPHMLSAIVERRHALSEGAEPLLITFSCRTWRNAGSYLLPVPRRESLILFALRRSALAYVFDDRGHPRRILLSITVDISISEMDLFFKISTNTCFDRCAKLVDAILLKASAFLLSPLGTCLMVNLSKPWISDLVLSRLRTPIRAYAMRLVSAIRACTPLVVVGYESNSAVRQLPVSGFSDEKIRQYCPFSAVADQLLHCAIVDSPLRYSDSPFSLISKYTKVYRCMYGQFPSRTVQIRLSSHLPTESLSAVPHGCARKLGCTALFVVFSGPADAVTVLSYCPDQFLLWSRPNVIRRGSHFGFGDTLLYAFQEALEGVTRPPRSSASYLLDLFDHDGRGETGSWVIRTSRRHMIHALTSLSVPLKKGPFPLVAALSELARTRLFSCTTVIAGDLNVSAHTDRPAVSESATPDRYFCSGNRDESRTFKRLSLCGLVQFRVDGNCSIPWAGPLDGTARIVIVLSPIIAIVWRMVILYHHKLSRAVMDVLLIANINVWVRYRVVSRQPHSDAVAVVETAISPWSLDCSWDCSYDLLFEYAFSAVSHGGGFSLNEATRSRAFIIIKAAYVGDFVQTPLAPVLHWQRSDNAPVLSITLSQFAGDTNLVCRLGFESSKSLGASSVETPSSVSVVSSYSGTLCSKGTPGDEVHSCEDQIICGIGASRGLLRDLSSLALGRSVLQPAGVHRWANVSLLLSLFLDFGQVFLRSGHHPWRHNLLIQKLANETSRFARSQI